MDTTDLKDFTDLTCTNLMIKLKILLNKLPPGDIVSFYATREQVDNTCSSFAGHGYQVSWDQKSDNRYLVRLGQIARSMFLVTARNVRLHSIPFAPPLVRCSSISFRSHTGPVLSKLIEVLRCSGYYRHYLSAADPFLVIRR